MTLANLWGILGWFLTGIVSLSVPCLYADVPQSWSSSFPTNKNLTAAIYGQGQYFVLGSGSMIIRSPDAFNWSPALQLGGPPGGGSSDHFFAAAYGNGMFVAGGQQNMLLAYSPNGANWTNIGTIGMEHVFGLTFANGRFVGVGSGALSPIYIITSTDGIHWAGSGGGPYPTSNTLFAVTYGNGVYVAVGDAGTIITSSDAATWILRNSGTTKRLRAVTYTGTRFLAGGESGTMVTSLDAISWSSSAPASFDITGLASGNGAVVAVGSYNGIDGRLHASSDGLTWPGNSVSAAQPLNGTSYVHDRFVALGNNGLLMQSEASTNVSSDVTGPNSWTKPTSGYWEEPYWSLGQLPSRTNSAILFTNSGYKALAIGANTTANFPNSLWIPSLTVDAPEGSANQLLLNFPGLGVPLRIDSELRIGTNASLVSYYAALQAATFSVNGAATLAELTQAAFSGSVSVGASNGPGELNIVNSSCSAGQLVLSASDFPGTLNQNGGTVQVGSLTMNNLSSYNLSNGVATAGALSLNGEGVAGIGRLNIWDGSMEVSNIIRIGSASFSSVGSGELLVAGGVLRSAGIDLFTGDIQQTGGTNNTGPIALPQNSNNGIGAGQYFLLGGALFSTEVDIGATSPFGATRNNGVFNQSGGVHRNAAGITTWGDIRHASASAAGSYRLSGGLLVSPNIAVQTGSFSQSGGTNQAGNFGVFTAGSFGLTAGTLLSSNFSVSSSFGSPTVFRELRSFHTQSGGTHTVQDLFSSGQGGVSRLQGGWLAAPRMAVGPNGELELTGALVTNTGTFTLLGGAQCRVAGDYPQLGKLIVASGSASLDLQNGASVIHFRDSRDQTWDSTLVITNWTGSTNGGGTDRVYVGTTAQGLTPQQVGLLRFANPAGMPPGIYAARILATGEIVPLPRPSISFTRSSNRMVLSWSGNFQLLSSTNVAGPYWPVGASSPHTNSFSEPQRFFELRSQ